MTLDTFLLIAFLFSPVSRAQEETPIESVDEEQVTSPSQVRQEKADDVRREEQQVLGSGQRLQPRNPVLRAWAMTMGERAYEAEFEFSQWDTTGAWDDQGTKVSLNGGSFTKKDSSLTLRYGLSDHLELRAGGRYRQNVSQTSANGEVDEVGPESGLIGLRYRMPPPGEGSRWLYTINLQYRKTLYQNDEYDPGRAPGDRIILGDDGAAALGEVQMSFQRNLNHVLNFSTGLRQPGSGLSTEIPLGAESTWFLGDSLSLGLGSRGIFSLGTDEDEDLDPADRPSMSTGATRLFNSVNREWVAPYAGLRWAFQSWSVGMEYSQVMRGISTDQGRELRFFLTWNTGGIRQEERKITRFKEYVIDAAVIKVSPRGLFIKIDHGEAQDVTKGMRFDLYKTDYFGGNVLIAEALAHEVGSDWAILKVIKNFRDIPIEKGNAARAR